MHATIPKGIVGGFEFTVHQRNLKEWPERPWTYVCECQRRATKVGLTPTVARNSVLIISHITFSRVHIFFRQLFQIAVYVRSIDRLYSTLEACFDVYLI